MRLQDKLFTKNWKHEVIIKSLIKGINHKISNQGQSENSKFLKNLG